MIKKAVIPAAGYGTRLLPITKVIPKVMIPILTKPTLQYVVEEAVSAGINEILIIIGWKGDVIREYYESHPQEMIDWLQTRNRPDLIQYIKSIIPKDVSISFKIQDILDGLAGAILRGRSFLGTDNFVVLLGDNIILEKSVGSLLEEMMKIHEKYSSAVTLCVAKVPSEDVSKFGIIGFKGHFEEEGRKVYEVTEIREKPPPEKAPSNLAIVGRYVFTPEIFDYLKKAPMIGMEIDETQAFKAQVLDEKKVYAFDLGSTKWFDVGKIDGYFKAFVLYVAYTEGIEKVREWLREIL